MLSLVYQVYMDRSGRSDHIDICYKHCVTSEFFFSLVSFLKKNKTYKIGSRCVCVCVCVCLYVCVCLCTILVPPINFQTSYAIDTKFWLHIVSYRNSPTPLIPFLKFENCALEKFLKLIFSPFN